MKTNSSFNTKSIRLWSAAFIVLFIMCLVPQRSFGDIIRYDIVSWGYVTIQSADPYWNSIVQRVTVTGTADVNFGPRFFDPTPVDPEHPEAAVTDMTFEYWLNGNRFAGASQLIWIPLRQTVYPISGGVGGVGPLRDGVWASPAWQFFVPSSFDLGDSTSVMDNGQFIGGTWMFGETGYRPFSLMTASNPRPVPEPSTCIAGALLLIPFIFQGRRLLRHS